jgi:AraC-like DNA-binding protein
MNDSAESGRATDPSRFRRLISSELFAMRYHGDDCARSQAPSLAGIHAGPVDVLRYCGLGEQWGGRDRSLIREDRADYFVVCIPVFGRLTVRQNGMEADLLPGCFTLVSTIRPFAARIRPRAWGEDFSALHIRVPGPLLRSRIPELDEICGRDIPIRPGSGRMMMSLLDVALNDGPQLSTGEMTQLGGTLLEAIGNVADLMAGRLCPRPQQPSARRRTLDRAKAFIASNLSNPELDPAQVAVHCGVSRRFLHASFATHSAESVAQFIRESRLQACREALRNPRLAHRTVIQIAGDRGFEDPSHFCRLYKRRFGVSPSQDRYGGAVTGN